MRVLARIWPSGEGAIWGEERRELGEDKGVVGAQAGGYLLGDGPDGPDGGLEDLGPEEGFPLGLSKVPNSQDLLEDRDYQAVQRGVNGITTYGAKMVRSACYLLQQKYGKYQLSFLTTTLPGTPEQTVAAARRWPEIVRRFLQALREKLIRVGLPPIVIGVTEVQERRFRETGGMPLHLHLVFRGRFGDRGEWCLSKDWVSACWRTCVLGLVPELENVGFGPSTRIERVRDSAAGYLGKYMSKGAGMIAKMAEDCPELLEFLPRQWWNATTECRAMVRSNTRYGEVVGETVEKALRHPQRDMMFEYLKEVPLLDASGKVIKKFWVFKVSRSFFRQFGIPVTPWDIAGLEM